jgi:hypothetical protein
MILNLSVRATQEERTFFQVVERRVLVSDKETPHLQFQQDSIF